ncbi:MAG: hypothetical protein Q8K75_02555 [Chlamydiales bacterium]|nr:hypothetical protein [Chlamydiales bacterium]
MKQKLAIYLAGTIKKAHEKADETYWGPIEIAQLQQSLHQYEITFLNPAFRADSMSDQKSVFGRDMTQVYCSDVVIVDARDRRGLGVGAEMMWAKVNSLPVIIWAPRDTHYHHGATVVLDREVNDWVHPFVECLADQVVEDLAQAASWIEANLLPQRTSIKGIEFIKSAMQHYRSTQLPHDTPMLELISAHPALLKDI